MLLKQLEPFAFGYCGCKSENVSAKIAEGMYGLCEDLPLSIDPEIGLASVDRSANGAINSLGAVYSCGDGIVCNGGAFERKAKEYPEYAAELSGYGDIFKNLVTYKIAKDAYTEEERILSQNNTLWGGTWGGHANPDYGLLLSLGTDGLREKIARCRKVNAGADEWYDASLRVLDGLDLLAARFRALALEYAGRGGSDREMYLRIADALETVPKHPARDFMSAAQMFYLVFTFDGRDSPGTFDQYMAPFYGKTDRDGDKRILEGLWNGFYKARSWNLCISGSDSDFNDLTNDLSYDILDVAEKKGYNTPNLTMRCHRNTPDRLFEKAARVIGTGIGMPALYNDEVVCPALEQLGIPKEDAHLYAMNGCNQIDIQGKSHMGLEDGEICLLKCLEYALSDGKCLVTGKQAGLRTGDPAEFGSFDELFAAYKKQVENAVKITVRLANASQKVFAENAPNPLRSILIEGCLEKGLDYKRGGPLYNHGQILTEGLADTTNSLMSIKHFVFDTGKYTMAEVADALAKDYGGYEEMYWEFRNYGGKFGNDIEEVDALGGEILSHFFTELMKYRTYRDSVNGIYGGGLSTFQRTGRYGRSCGASADGRHSGDVNIADSIGPVPGTDVNGPTAVIKSALHYDQRLAKSGFVLQLKFDKALFNSSKGQKGFVSLVKAYFAGGGQQLSVNVLSPEELLEARKNPDKYRNLIVRVGGFSDYFVNLSDDLKDNIIARTTFGL